MRFLPKYAFMIVFSGVPTPAGKKEIVILQNI
jgi:hypothetical protein